MDFKAIEEMIKTMDDSKLGYLEVNWQGISIIMRKQGEQALTVPVKGTEFIEKEAGGIPSVNEDVVSAVNNEIKSEEVTELLSKKVEAKVEDENIKEIISPIVGTFYGSSSPDKPSFVSVGSKVKKGDVLCIVEAMKLMNEIQSEFNGEIVEILVNNEQMVEYGQPMFKVRVQE
ncbi:acetyl-CoA carboxylase biotin carboxyl carrier protein [Clostridium sp. DJ247]|uniref:acetyl-CoA carboxylase biotin carboxyl carrier protein n=1 Tax=Clostridium sp. DJ247 TaxID=2726188 RepID=UPI0016247444|nr:acetyl-CoA carboxylase biotin carboxyl carrier protein [Clostridium sp. DJ247]MBC2580933.1 acetyl-CoA carboxylase biotin carboxyl carrier protein [Clostridium sp. DJ247]